MSIDELRSKAFTAFVRTLPPRDTPAYSYAGDAVLLADAEAALAGCEQQRDALAGMDHAAEHYRKERDVAERKLAAAREALQAYRNFKPFDWRFDHSGAMNATALGERDVYLKIKAKADKVLTAPTEAGEGEN